MERVAIRRLWAVCSILLFAVGLVGCTTNITPPSGPVGTEVCFDPAPFTFVDDVERTPCPWHVWMETPDGESFIEVGETYDKCFDIPAECLVGREYTVTVAGKWSIGCSLYFPYPAAFYGSFVVTE